MQVKCEVCGTMFEGAATRKACGLECRKVRRRKRKVQERMRNRARNRRVTDEERAAWATMVPE